MPAPPYMRFYIDAYCKDTLTLSMEEQGVYVRLLCTMWKHGGKIRDDDSFIARALPIQIHKWRKVRPRLMPFLQHHSEGFLTQKRLNLEYHFSSGDKKQNTDSTTGVTPPATHPVTPHVTPPVTRGVTPPVDPFAAQKAANEKRQQIQRFEDIPPGGVAYALARALDQSRSRLNLDKNSRLLEDGDPDACGKPDNDAVAKRFVNEAILAFEKHGLNPPSDYSVVNGWVVNGCDLMRHILPAIEASLNRTSKATDPPQSWKYFAHEVYARKKSNRENHDG